jgi:hypothetical protein
VLRYGDFTAKGRAGGRAGENVDAACADVRSRLQAANTK